MKRSRLVPLAAALAWALPARAQEAPPAAPEPPAAAAPLPAVADLLRGGLFAGAVQERPEWMEKTVSVAAEERPAALLVKEILEKVGLKRFVIFLSGGGENASREGFNSLTAKGEGLLSQPFGEPVTLKLENVRAEEALRKLASAAGVRMTFTQEDGLTRVDLAKTPRSIKVYTIGSPEVEADAAVRDALLAARDLATTLVRPGDAAVLAPPGAPLPPMASTEEALGGVWRGGALPDRRVSLDVREREAREVLKDLLKQAQADYVLEEDLPDRKVTLAFKNSPVAVALDVVCNTLSIGWRAERQGKKALVRIGAKYRRGEGQATLAAPLIFTAPAPARP